MTPEAEVARLLVVDADPALAGLLEEWLTHQWDFWPLMSLTLEEARAKCGLLPKLA